MNSKENECNCKERYYLQFEYDSLEDVVDNAYIFDTIESAIEVANRYSIYNTFKNCKYKILDDKLNCVYEGEVE
jgi:hypothetical protein